MKGPRGYTLIILLTNPKTQKGDAYSQLLSNDAGADETRQANRPSVHMAPPQ